MANDVFNGGKGFQLSLVSDPDKITVNAKDIAEKHIYQALLEMGKINLRSPGYGPLNELFSQAKSEWYRGVLAHENARATKDRESIYYFSQALTAFTRCHALAQRVYEELVPNVRAKFPEDLGYERPKRFIGFSRPHKTSW